MIIVLRRFFHFFLNFDNKKWIEKCLYRDIKNFPRVLLNKRITSTYWRALYQQKDANSTFQNISDLFENVLNILASMKSGEPMNILTKKVDV